LGDNKYKQNVGGETSWKLTTWRTQERCEDTIIDLREISRRCMELVQGHVERQFFVLVTLNLQVLLPQD
jgi:hypothetical protein